MNPFDHNLDRRDLLKQGGLALSLGALVAACGSDRGGSDDPGRIGFVAAGEEDPGDTTVDDAVLLRTMQSLEYAVIELHTSLLDMGAFGDAAPVAERFIADHQRHADEIGELVTQAGGEPFACANPFFMARSVEPVLAAVEASDDVTGDALTAAEAFESNLGASYQALVADIEDAELRASMIAVGGEECRHAAAVALAINPDVPAPELAAEDNFEEGSAAPVYAIPAPFGQLTGIVWTGSTALDDGSFPSVTLQTPAENTYAFNDRSC